MNGRTAGVLLAGGLGRRMGSRDKALVPLAGRPMIAYAAARLAPQVATLLINANGDPARFAHLGLPVVPDETPDRPGPLGGVLAALNYIRAASPGVRLLTSVPADTPLIPRDFVAQLAAALADTPSARVAVAQSRQRRHFVAALWRIESCDEIAAALAEGQRRAESLVDRLGAVSVPFPDVVVAGRAVDPFFNVNTPEDVAFAESILSAPDAEENRPPVVVGVAGWKNSGKTTLVERLIAELVGRGFSVSTIKHSHHHIDAERPGTDSARHRAAGARHVALVSPRRWTIDGTIQDEPEPTLTTIVTRLSAVDIVIVEGMKRADIPKIEVRRLAARDNGAPLTDGDPNFFAIAADHSVQNAGVPVFHLDDVTAVADALLQMAKLPLRKEGA